MDLWLLLLLGLAAVQVRPGHSGEAEMMCRQFGLLHTTLCGAPDEMSTPQRTQGATGKKGPKGDAGSRGSRGPRGPPGEIDYSRIDATIEARVAAATEKLVARVEDLERRLNASSREAPEISDPCPVSYDGKSFRAILYRDETMNFYEAEELCQDMNATLANIYDMDLYGKLETYLRETMPSDRSYVSAWIGMIYRTWIHNMLYLHDGSGLIRLPWLNGYPTGGRTSIRTALHMAKNENSSSGIKNQVADSNQVGALCEFPTA